MKIHHLIPVVDDEASASLKAAQAVTVASVLRAVAFSEANEVTVTLVGTLSPEVSRSLSPSFSVSQNRKPSSRELIGKGPALPQIADIFSNALPADPHELIVYSQPDIAVQPYFYDAVAALYSHTGSSGSIPRRTLPIDSLTASEMSLLYAEIGAPHPGHDCFFFPKRLLPELEMGALFVGSPATDRVLTLNLRLLAEGFHIHRDKALTFHFGDEREWSKDSSRRHLNELNWHEASRVVSSLQHRFSKGEVEVLLEKTGLGRLGSPDGSLLWFRLMKRSRRWGKSVRRVFGQVRRLR